MKDFGLPASREVSAFLLQQAEWSGKLPHRQEKTRHQAG
ncbi:hypothetical protein DLM_2554 [Aquitalea magnusonii]|uniref:Uncharacterized protein n=1 Tax=Aquitalea magnusonii TaxID=332411 RepID=A0A3G9GIR3_9NEIS|nr:hypothetical protein DLM_2554 [Aquitalea magnusonii]